MRSGAAKLDGSAGISSPCATSTLFYCISIMEGLAEVIYGKLKRCLRYDEQLPGLKMRPVMLADSIHANCGNSAGPAMMPPMCRATVVFCCTDITSYMAKMNCRGSTAAHGHLLAISSPLMWCYRLSGRAMNWASTRTVRPYSFATRGTCVVLPA